MDDRILADQRELVDLLESAGWEVTGTELSVYESPWEDDETPEASVTLSARKRYPNGSENDEDENPFRVR